MALDQLGVGTQIVTVAVGAVLGGTALALGLAFGLGGKDKAKQMIEKSGKESMSMDG
jgi:Ca2+/H+ antiporter